MLSDVINVPIGKLKDAATCKDKAVKFEVFCCAVMIKLKYNNSTLYNLNQKTARETFHCGAVLSKRLVEEIKQSGYFVYNEKKNCVFVKSFKSKEKKAIHWHNQTFVSNADYCVKVPRSVADMKFKDVKKFLRSMLLANLFKYEQRVNGVDAKDLKVSLAEDWPNCDATRWTKPLKLRILSSAMGMSRSSASRYVKMMESHKEVSKTMTIAEVVIPEYTAEKLYDYMTRHRGQYVYTSYDTANHCMRCWVVKGRMYSLVDDELLRRFQHVIYKHRTRTKVTAAEASGNEDDVHENFHGPKNTMRNEKKQ